jgi:hypothetical protein
MSSSDNKFLDNLLLSRVVALHSRLNVCRYALLLFCRGGWLLAFYILLESIKNPGGLVVCCNNICILFCTSQYSGCLNFAIILRIDWTSYCGFKERYSLPPMHAQIKILQN